jgi:hypothetical protein
MNYSKRTVDVVSGSLNPLKHSHNPERCSYSAISLINNSFHHLSDYRKGHECREKKPDDQDRQICYNPGFQVVTGG